MDGDIRNNVYDDGSSDTLTGEQHPQLLICVRRHCDAVVLLFRLEKDTSANVARLSVR